MLFAVPPAWWKHPQLELFRLHRASPGSQIKEHIILLVVSNRVAWGSGDGDYSSILSGLLRPDGWFHSSFSTCLPSFQSLLNNCNLQQQCASIRNFMPLGNGWIPLRIRGKCSEFLCHLIAKAAVWLSVVTYVDMRNFWSGFPWLLLWTRRSLQLVCLQVTATENQIDYARKRCPCSSSEWHFGFFKLYNWRTEKEWQLQKSLRKPMSAKLRRFAPARYYTWQ